RTGAVGWSWLLATDDARALDPGAVTSRLWVGLDESADPTQAVPAIQDAIVDVDIPVEVAGAAVERALMESVIDTILGVIVGLLAVAVVIALIGVANTLSLSVIERRRESATLRAIGLSRAQLRWMLAIEGMLIAGVGAVLGIALGVLYGWAGAATALSIMGDVSLAVPWRDVALVLVVRLAAGLVAPVGPGRTAARPWPVAALAVDGPDDGTPPAHARRAPLWTDHPATGARSCAERGGVRRARSRGAARPATRRVRPPRGTAALRHAGRCARRAARDRPPRHRRPARRRCPPGRRARRARAPRVPSRAPHGASGRGRRRRRRRPAVRHPPPAPRRDARRPVWAVDRPGAVRRPPGVVRRGAGRGGCARRRRPRTRRRGPRRPAAPRGRGRRG